MGTNRAESYDLSLEVKDGKAQIDCNVKKYIAQDAPGGKEHIGYIVDRTGFAEYRRWAMKDVTLPPIAEVADTLYWGGKHYD
jgi:dissimilatory sulfite reductase (desulfoviridin) alpha/beta subunit